MTNPDERLSALEERILRLEQKVLSQQDTSPGVIRHSLSADEERQRMANQRLIENRAKW